jgi:hypothetical protein
MYDMNDEYFIIEIKNKAVMYFKGIVDNGITFSKVEDKAHQFESLTGVHNTADAIMKAYPELECTVLVKRR